MQLKIKILIFIALVSALAYFYYKSYRYESLSTVLLEENTKVKGKTSTKDNSTSLRQKVEALEAENKLLKDQIFQLEKQQFLFNSNQNSEEKYKLEENLKFKDENKQLNKKLEQSEELKKDDEYKITPSIEFDQEKRSIDGIKLEVETKF